MKKRRRRAARETVGAGAIVVVGGESGAAILAAPDALPGAEAVLFRLMGSKAKNTILAYRRDLKQFAAWLGVADGGEAVRVLLTCRAVKANQLVFGWLHSMSEAGLSTATRTRRLATVRVVVETARKMELVTWSISEKSPNVEKVRDVRGPTPEQFASMLAACDRSALGLRNRVVLLLMGGLALRRVEVARLRLKDYDRDRMTLRVLGKRNKISYITLRQQRFVAALEMWIADAKIADLEAPLVHSFTEPGKPINLHGLNYIVMQIGKRAGVSVRPHGLRHMAITQSLDGYGIRDVQKFSRHSDVRMVEVYDDNKKDVAGDITKTVLDSLMGDWEP